MQTQNPFLDEMAKLTAAAMGLAQSAGEEAKAAFRSQADRFVAEMDLIRRDEYEVLKPRSPCCGPRSQTSRQLRSKRRRRRTEPASGPGIHRNVARPAEEAGEAVARTGLNEDVPVIRGGPPRR